VLIGEGIGDRAGQCTGIALFAVGTGVSQFKHCAIGPFFGFCFPHFLVETDVAAVQRIGSVVSGERGSLAVESELALGDAIGVTADERTKIGMSSQVAFQIIESEDDVAELAVAIGYIELGDNSSVGYHLGLDAVVVRKRVQVNGSAVGGLAEVA